MAQFIGTIEHILFYSPETGYTVCRFSAQDSGEIFTVVGNFPPLSPGEILKVTGDWETNPKFGKQFKVENYLPVMPSSVKGIEKFLSSGLIKGIGPELAGRIIDRFGAETIDILTDDPGKLGGISGIGPVKLKEIKRSWTEHQQIRDLIIFLQDHGISTNLATKIYKQYGDRSFFVLKNNPYQACFDIWGVGFKTADQMALKLGISPDSDERLKAFIRYLLEKDNEQGHVFSLEQYLIERCVKDLMADEEKVQAAIRDLHREKLVVAEKHSGQTAVYLPFFHKAQEEVARNIQNLASIACLPPDFDVDKKISLAEKELGIAFSENQKSAIKKSVLEKIVIITGGPGTGKTTIIKAVVDVFDDWEKSVILGAPTGRAAKRLSEATSTEARTLHRILEFNPKLGEFRRNESRPLGAEVLIIDEFSMVDLPLMYHLLKAVPDWMRLILVGDKDQLPSVGPGNLLHDIIESNTVEVVELHEIFRQEKDSLIVQNAHRVKQGEKLIYPEKGDKDSDFYFIGQDDEQKVFQMIMEMSTERIPLRLGFDPSSPEIQVISPMYRGMIGVDNLNKELQSRLNPGGEGLKLGHREIRVRDKVMQLRNNYDKDIYNGDIGIVSEVDRESYRLLVDFYGRAISFEKDEISELTLAYAVSVHKSQGSEYTAVVMPLLTQHFIMLQRNLFYTALTRAKRLSVIIGSYKALYIAIKNDKPIKRNTRLKEKLMDWGNPKRRSQKA